MYINISVRVSGLALRDLRTLLHITLSLFAFLRVLLLELPLETDLKLMLLSSISSGLCFFEFLLICSDES